MTATFRITSSHSHCKIIVKYVWMVNLRDLMPTLQFFADIYEKNSSPTNRYYTICERYVQISRKIMLRGHWAYVVLYTMFFLSGLSECLRSSGRMQILHIYFPGIFADSLVMIVPLAMWNTMCLIQAAFLVPAPDMLFYFAFGSVPIVPAIVRHLMNELNNLLRHYQPNSDDVVFIRKQLAHYIGIHLKYNE